MKGVSVVLFGLTAFLASALLFTAEPMIGKMVLPLFGGTPAVWNTCLLYFQVVLLAAYGLSGRLGTAVGNDLPTRSNAYLVVGGLLLLMACAMPPIALHSGDGGSSRDPTVDLLAILAASATLPLLVVATAAPLTQRAGSV